MEYEKTVQARHISIEDMTGRKFLNCTPSIGEEVVGRVDGKLYTWGWRINDPDEDWSGIGPLGVRIDEDAFRLRRELIVIDGYGEWIPEEKTDV